MKNYKLSELKNDQYFGIDVSLETSLFEYGICGKKEVTQDGALFLEVIYRIGENVFDRANITTLEAIELTNESWFNKESFESFRGLKVEPISNEYDLLNLVSDMLSYYGYENIFGSSYYGLTIENDL